LSLTLHAREWNKSWAPAAIGPIRAEMPPFADTGWARIEQSSEAVGHSTMQPILSLPNSDLAGSKGPGIQ
jgi:hypothetical protein